MEKDFQKEIEKCKDPVYFYENYWLVNGEKPIPLTESEKQALRASVQLRGKKIVVVGRSSEDLLQYLKCHEDIELMDSFDEPPIHEITIPFTMTCPNPVQPSPPDLRPPSKREKARQRRRGTRHYDL